MKASPSEAILIPLASNPADSAATDTVVLSCSDSLAVGGEIAWHRGGALYLPRKEGDSGLRPSCCQDGTLVPFSLMTNPAGLILIISTHKQRTHSLAHKYADTHTDGLKVCQASVEKGIEGQDDRELFFFFLKTNFFPLGNNYSANLSCFFFCIDRSIYMPRGVPGNVQKQ